MSNKEKDTSSKDTTKEEGEKVSSNNKISKSGDSVDDKVDATLESAEKTLEKAGETSINKVDTVSEVVPPVEEQTSSRWILIVLLLVLIIAVVYVFIAKVTINPKDVEARLQSFEDTIANQLSQSGADLDIVYGPMRIEGSLFSKKIVLNSPEIHFISNSGREYDITTKNMEILPNGDDLDNVKLHLTEPVIVKYMDETDIVSFTPDFISNVHLHKKNIKYNGEVPLKIKVVKGGVDSSDDVIAYLKVVSGKFKGVINGDNGNSSQSLSLSNGSIKAFEYQGDFDKLIAKKSGSQDEGVADNSYDVEIKKLLVAGALNVLGKLDVNLKLGQEMTSFSEEYGYPSEVNYNLEKLSIKNINSAINADGKFQVLENELVPLGKAEINISGVDNIFSTLRKKGIINDKSEAIARSTIGKIANEWKPESDEVNITFQREYGGGFYIGNVTFEELFAGAVKEYFMGVKAKPLVSTSSKKTKVKAKAKIKGEKSVKEVVKEKLEKTGVKIPKDIHDSDNNSLDKTLPVALTPVIGEGNVAVEKNTKNIGDSIAKSKPVLKKVINIKPSHEVIKDKAIKVKNTKPEVKIEKVKPISKVVSKVKENDAVSATTDNAAEKSSKPVAGERKDLPWLNKKSSFNSLEVPKELNIVTENNNEVSLKKKDVVVPKLKNVTNKKIESSVGKEKNNAIEPSSDELDSKKSSSIDPTLKQKLKEAAAAAKQLQLEAK